MVGSLEDRAWSPEPSGLGILSLGHDHLAPVRANLLPLRGSQAVRFHSAILGEHGP